MSHSMRWGMLLDETALEIIEQARGQDCSILIITESPYNKNPLGMFEVPMGFLFLLYQKYILSYRLINSIRALLTPGEDASK